MEFCAEGLYFELMKEQPKFKVGDSVVAYFTSTILEGIISKIEYNENHFKYTITRESGAYFFAHEGIMENKFKVGDLVIAEERINEDLIIMGQIIELDSNEARVRLSSGEVLKTMLATCKKLNIRIEE